MKAAPLVSGCNRTASRSSFTFTTKTAEPIVAVATGFLKVVLAMKYNIHLKGSGKAIEIVYNSDLGLRAAGRVLASNPYAIEIGPLALTSESELANTIAHELNHARDFIRGGNAPERQAYRSGDSLAHYIAGRR